MQEVFEIWKDIEGYEGCYQVSNKGNVRSVDRYIECRGSLRMQKGKVLKPYVNKYGYRQVILNGKLTFSGGKTNGKICTLVKN